MNMPRFLISLVLLVLVVPLAVSAHVVGESYEVPSGADTVDIGYSTKTPDVRESVQFDFRLRKGQDPQPFSDVWVNITAADGSVVYASGLYNSPFGGPRLSYVFPHPGKYTISARFENGTEMHEGSFPMTVTPAPGTSPLIPFSYAGGGFVLGGAAAFILLRRREKAVRVARTGSF